MFANYSDEMKEYGQAFESRCDDVYVIILDLIWFDFLHESFFLAWKPPSHWEVVSHFTGIFFWDMGSLLPTYHWKFLTMTRCSFSIKRSCEPGLAPVPTAMTEHLVTKKFCPILQSEGVLHTSVISKWGACPQTMYSSFQWNDKLILCHFVWRMYVDRGRARPSVVPSTYF